MTALESRSESATRPRRNAHVARPRLERLLDDVEPGGTALVIAPAGSGKSILLRQWAERSTSRVAWLSLERAHDDPAILARELWTTCAGVSDAFGPDADRPRPRGPGLGRLFVDTLLSKLAASHEPILIVLDDAHHLTDTAIVEDLGRLVVRLPPTARAVVASRWDPALSLSSLRLEGLVEVRADDLSFDVEEASALVAGVLGHRLDPGLVTSLVDRTGGWSAGLHLASVSLRRTDDPAEFVSRFAGDDSLVAEYLTEEVLRHEGDEMRTFLLRTSVLDELDPELCALVAEQDVTAATLDDLERRGLFVVPAAPPHGRRYHHLFARLLRYQLRNEDPDGERRARSAAAEWHLERGEFHPAIEQILAAGDAERAFSIIATAGFHVFMRGESATLVRWLTRIADAGVEPRTDVALNLFAAQLGADQYTAAEETYRHLMLVSDLPPRHRAAAEVLHAILGQRDLPIGQVRRSVDAALSALEQAGDDLAVDFLGIGDRDTIEIMAEHMRGHADLYETDLIGAKETFEDALELPGARFPIWRVSSLGALAVTDALLGLDRSSEELAAAAVQCANDARSEHHVSLTMSHLSTAIVRLDRLDTDAAQLGLDRAARCAEQSGRPFLHHLRQLQEARRHLLLGDAESALDLLRVSIAPGLERRVIRQLRDELLVRVLVRLGRLGEAKGVLLTAAEPHPLALADLHIASGALDDARSVLEELDADPLDIRTRTELDIRLALLADARGESGRAGEILADALEGAEHEGLYAPFVESSQALGILRTAAPRRVAPLVQRIVDAHRLAGGRDMSNHTLVEPLTDRELGVLEYLPSRLSNTEIAGTLYISVNTLKTHLRNIYRKLEATDRDSAVVAASKLDLL